MQFIYIDESGLGEEPISVMVGVIADSHRMRVTKEHWNTLLSELSKIVGREISEIHTRDLYSGNSPWRELNGEQRSSIITAIFNWLNARRHSIVFAAVNKTKFLSEFKTDEEFTDIKTLWRFMALHLVLALQKNFQGAKRKNKRKINQSGHFVLIFDNEFREEKHFTDLLLNAPDWTNSYYNKLEHQEKLSQLVDVPHFVDSKDVGLIQLADFLCFFLRKYVELESELSQESYEGEKEKVKAWTESFLSQSIPLRNIFLSRGGNSCTELFNKYAPEVLTV